MILGIHHTGFIVEDLEQSIEFYQSLGFELVKRFEKPNLKAKSAYLKKDKSLIEIFDFEDENTPMADTIRKHTALETNNIEEDIKKFQDNEFEIVIPITKGITVKKFAFIKDKKDNIFELYQGGVN